MRKKVRWEPKLGQAGKDGIASHYQTVGAKASGQALLHTLKMALQM